MINLLVLIYEFPKLHISAPDLSKFEDIPVSELPRCEKDECNGLLRPGVVWFGENLDPNVLMKAGK